MFQFLSCSCSICKVLCPSNKMDWLSTSAEHMNSHAMHFPCLKANVVTSNNNNNNNTNNNNNNINNNNELNSNRVLACKDCKDYLASQWETMDADRVPLEHRRFSIWIPWIHVNVSHWLYPFPFADTTFPRPCWPPAHPTDLGMAPWASTLRPPRHPFHPRRLPAHQSTAISAASTRTWR